MKLINYSDLHQISGASDYMCIYSIVQYQNSRFVMLDHAYQNNTIEDTYWFKRDQEMFEMYGDWVDQYCSPEVVEEYIGK